MSRTSTGRILGVHWGVIGVIVDNGKENGNYSLQALVISCYTDALTDDRQGLRRRRLPGRATRPSKS